MVCRLALSLGAAACTLLLPEAREVCEATLLASPGAAAVIPLRKRPVRKFHTCFNPWTAVTYLQHPLQLASPAGDPCLMYSRGM